MTIGKNIALTRQTFVGKVISLLFNVLCRLIITFLPRSKCLLISWLQFSLVAQMVKHLPTTWETWVRSLGQEDPLEKEMATHSSTLAWRIPWTEDPGRLQPMGSQRVRHNFTFTFTFLSVTICSDFGGQKNKVSHCLHCFPIYLL